MKDVNQLFVDHEKWLHALTRKNIGRLKQVGHNIELEELFSIFCEVFMNSVNCWNAEQGKLTTYLSYACHNKVTSMLEVHFRGEINTKRESEMHNSSYGEDDDQFSLDNIQSENFNETIGELVVMNALKYEAQKLSPFARLLLEYTLNPPEFIMNEIKAQDAKGEYSKGLVEDRRGYTRRTMSIKFVAKCLERTAKDSEAKNFIRKAVREVETAVYQAIA